jgi:FkbM family methyltransferase
MTGGRKNGFFVELGSTDGVELNNTFLLESLFQWQGICVEPNEQYYRSLVANRTAQCYQRALWHTSNEQLPFIARGTLGSFEEMAFSDGHAETRRAHHNKHGSVIVTTISLADLFTVAAVPFEFDYLSIDIEGAERIALEAFDFSKYSFALATIEHNSNKATRELAQDLLSARGFQRISMRYEDWFFHEELLAKRNYGRTLDVAAITNAFVALNTV